jgi:hypothetical protein
LDETDAVLLGRGFHGAGVEHFVVEVDILEVFEVLILVFDPKVAGVLCLPRRHVEAGLLEVVAVVSKERAQRREELA